MRRWFLVPDDLFPVTWSGRTAVVVVPLGACTATVYHQGFQSVDVRPADVKVGEDTRSTVLSKLGSPTATSTFDKDLWFYMSQLRSQTSFYPAKTIQREVVAISFDHDTELVMSVDKYTIRDGRVIAYNSHETPTRVPGGNSAEGDETTSATIWWPGISAGSFCGNSPAAICRSVRQTPQARTLSSASPGAGVGKGTSSRTSGRSRSGAGLWRMAARMIGISWEQHPFCYRRTALESVELDF